MSGTSIWLRAIGEVVAGLGDPPALLHAGVEPVVDLGEAVVQRAVPACSTAPW